MDSAVATGSDIAAATGGQQRSHLPLCSERQGLLAAAGFALVVALIRLLDQPAKLLWDPDSALYLMHAANIVNTSPYAQTGYIFNPLNAIHPAAYPPGLPLLLAPVYWLNGLDLLAMQAVITVCYALLLVVLFLIARRYLPIAAALAVMVIIGVNPMLWYFASAIYSEWPFMLAAYTGLWLCDAIRQRAGGSPVRRLLSILAAGALIGFAVETRAIGLLLVPVVLASALLQQRPLQWMPLIDSIGVVGIGIGVVAALRISFPHGNGTYFDYFHAYDWAALPGAIWLYLRTIPYELFGIWALRGLADAGAMIVPLAWTLAAVAMFLAAIGFAAAVRRGPTVFEAFTAVYAAFLVVYPIREEPGRYALPLYPLFVLYAAVGLRMLLRHLSRPAGVGIIGSIIAMLGGVLVAGHVAVNLPRPWMLSPDGEGLLRAIRERTAEDAVILTAEPTTIALFTGRRAAIWPAPADTTMRRDFARSIDAGYLVLSRGSDLGSMPRTLPPLYANEGYLLLPLSR